MKNAITAPLGTIWGDPLGLGVYQRQDLTILNLKAKDSDVSKAANDYHGTDGDDSVVFYENSGAKNIYTYGGADDITLNGFADYTVRLGSGNDVVTINSALAADVHGGEDNDIFHVETLANHVLNGGSGLDYVFLGAIGQGMIVDLVEGTARLATGGNREIRLANVERVYGTDSDDLMRAADTGSSLFGQGGDDQIYGGVGSDVLWGEAGTDHIFGGGGNDILSGGGITTPCTAMAAMTNCTVRAAMTSFGPVTGATRFLEVMAQIGCMRARTAASGMTRSMDPNFWRIQTMELTRWITGFPMDSSRSARL